jgi:hypothetical protein
MEVMWPGGEKDTEKDVEAWDMYCEWILYFEASLPVIVSS